MATAVIATISCACMFYVNKKGNDREERRVTATETAELCVGCTCVIDSQQSKAFNYSYRIGLPLV